MTLKIAVMASTKGTDLQAIIEAIKKKELDAEIRIVIANKECPAIERARNNGFKTKVVPYDKDKDTRENYDKKIAEMLDEEKIELIVLVGYMRLFSKWFVQKYKNKIINIHPSLLPSFPGMGISVHQNILDYGCKVSGCTIHFVDEGMDTGPIIMQGTVEIEDNETADSLKEKVQALEKRLYPKVIHLFGQGKIKVQNRKVFIDK
ncbi:phosphoribosylglycinamide formyltransferase [Candidatus Woesearchaeota archaeon]|nr:phosphoribosylglycinamide formyltransferase [Candidatus Woesearchaeota archaeon]